MLNMLLLLLLLHVFNSPETEKKKKEKLQWKVSNRNDGTVSNAKSIFV